MERSSRQTELQRQKLTPGCVWRENSQQRLEEGKRQETLRPRSLPRPLLATPQPFSQPRQHCFVITARAARSQLKFPVTLSRTLGLSVDRCQFRSSRWKFRGWLLPKWLSVSEMLPQRQWRDKLSRTSQVHCQEHQLSAGEAL